MVMKEVFDGWMKMHGKNYESSSEYDERLEIFSQNADIVAKHNSEQHSYTSRSAMQCTARY